MLWNYAEGASTSSSSVVAKGVIYSPSNGITESSDTIATILTREPDWTALPASTPPAIHRLLHRCLEKDPKQRLHDIADARIERAWGGPIDVSADHLPFFGTVKGKRIHYGIGYSGHGVGPTWLGGQILASLVLQRDDEWTALPLASRRVASTAMSPTLSIAILPIQR